MWWTRKSGKDLFERPLVEQLEPRLLYSADLAAALGLPATGSPAPQERTLDDDGEFTQEAAQASSVAATTSAQATQSAVPLAFEVNAGQADASLDLLARGSGYAVGLSGGNATLVLGSGDAARVLQMQLLNANAGVGASAEGLLAGRTNYFIGSDPANWHTDIANYSSVTYRGVYDGIDLRYYGNSRQLEYDFIVKAGSDVQAIALRFDGAQALSIDADGNLVLTLDVESGSAIRFLAPVAYQEGAGGREAVASRYVLGADGSVHFEVADYDHARTLVIDPVLAYGTYLGGTSAEAANAIATDAAGNVYLAGYGNSTVLGLGGENVMVSKFSADLTTNLYTTYYGGLANERATALAVDASGNVYVTGWTKSGGLGAFPTSGGAYQTSLSGAQDAFVLKLDASGSTIVYSSYLGGSGNGDIGNGIAIDATGNAYVAGTTNSSNFPTTAGAADRTFAGNEAFVTKFNTAGTALVYSSFVGGSGNEEGYAIAVDGTGRAVIVGMTASNNFSLVGASQTGNAGTQDAFVARLNSAGSAFDFSTYYGGTKEETAYAVALRADGTIVIGGVSKSNDLPITSGAVQNSRSGGGDSGFVAIVNPSTATLAYATYLGGRGGNEAVTGMALDAAGRVYAVGYSGANSFTTSANALDASYSGATDAFVTLIDPALSGNAGLLYSSYLGGTGADRARGAVFSGGTLFVTGETASSSGIATSGGADTTYAGGTDAFVVGFTGLDGQNTAPVLSGANNLATILEDAASNAGTLVSALLTGRFSDADVGGLQGIAVTAVDNSNGTWQYSTNGGSSWTAFGTPGGAAARLLAADGNTYVRFVPNANWNGSVAGGLTFRAWDQTSGTAGGTADTTANGGATAFSVATAASSISVTAVNDAPSGSSNTVTTQEDSAYTFTIADFGYSDTADTPANALANIKITTLPVAGTLTLSGAAVVAGQFVSAANISAGNLKFTPAVNASGAGYASFTFQVQDNGGAANGGADLDPAQRTMTVDVGPVNDAPVITLPAAQATPANTAKIYSVAGGNAISISDLDAAAASVQVTLSAASGTLTLNGTAGLAFSVGTGTADAVMTFTGSVAAINAALDGLRFDPAGGFSGSTSFSVDVDDLGNSGTGGAQQASGTAVVNVAFVNSAPTLAGANNLAAVLEDAVGDAGTAVGALLAGQMGDIDPGALQGIAITAADNSSGAWQYSTNGGSSWTAFGTPSGAAARLLAADGNTYVRFVPNANWNGSVAGGLTFRAWDQTSGTAGGTADTTANGGATAFSTATADSSVTVTAVNDAPSGSSQTVTTLEDAPYTFGAADFGFADALDAPANALANVRITNLPAAGTLTNNGIAVLAGQFVSIADIAAGKLVFTPVANTNGSAYAVIGFQVQDDGGTANGGIDLDPLTRQLTIDVTEVSNAPVGADKTVTTFEGTAYTFALADFTFTDTDDAPANNLFNVRIAALPGAGALTLNGTAVTAGQYVSAADIAAGKLAYAPAADANGAAYATFGFQVQDDGGTANGGEDLDTVVRTMTVDVTPVNDAPQGGDQTIAVFEDTPYTFGLGDFGFTDAVDSPANGLLNVRITSVPTTGTLTLNGTVVAAGQFISAADIAANRLVFAAAPNASGLAAATFAFQVQDDGGVLNGGIDLEAGAHTITLDVAAVNDAPTGADHTVAAQEDAAYTFGVADFGFGDALDGPANNLLNVRIATLPSAGALTLNGAAVTAGQSISAADIAAGKLVFNPAADSNGSAYAGFTFQVQDDGGTANGGADLDTSPRTMTVDVAAVNDAPAGQDNTVTTLEDTAYVFNIADFGFADPADTPANELMGVKFSLLPAAGTLTLNGVTLTAGQTVSAADIVAGKLAFTPDANANGSAYGMFRFQLQDDGGSALGGVDLDPVSKAMTIDVSPVNDPPVSVDRTFPPLPGGTHVFTVADFAFADPGDVAAPDAFDGVRIATLPASGGLLLYGAPVAAGQYISAADITAGGLRYIASPGGTGSFAFAVQDAGSTANGGSNTEAGTHLMSFGDPQAAPLPPPPLPADPTPVVPVATSPPVLTTPATTAPAAAAAATVPAGGDGVIIPGSGTRELNAELARSAEQLQLSTARREAEAEVRVAGISVLEHRGDTPATQADLLDLIMQNLGTSASASPALFEQLANSMRDQGFISELDRMREEARGEFSLDNIFAVSAGGVTFGLSVVVVIWIIRSGVLLGSLLSAMPAWRVLDPLPVLSRSSDGKAEEEDDEDYQSFDAGEADADPERVLRES